MFLLLLVFLATDLLRCQDLPASLPQIKFHLPAHPWESTNISASDYLDDIEGLCRVANKFQDESGAIIDPYLKREHQYSTPYYAFAVATLLKAGRAKDLKESGIKAMDHATKSFAGGSTAIPDAHGEFFIAALTGALPLFEGAVADDKWTKWEKRLQTPLASVMSNFTERINNWRTYAMKGEWMRAHEGLVNKDSTINFIELAWDEYTQRERIMLDKWNLYQDWSSDPQSHAVEAVGRGNLTGLVMEGYDGPSADEMLKAIRKGAQTSLLLQSPTGQAPPNGRTDNHVFNDILYQLIFEVMANDAIADGNKQLAGQYKRAAHLGYKSIQRWKRDNKPWEGSFYITKNHFEPGERIGYQPASQWGNYSGTMMFHLAEAYLAAKKSDVSERPTPNEIGGYAFSTDERFSSFVANAGGMQVFLNLRGASVPKYGIYWTPLGAVRFAKTGWDDRLGPSDGIGDPEAGEPLSFSRGSGETADQYRAQSGITFGPSWQEKGQWIRLADLALHYRGTVQVDFVHPLLVKFTVTYSYITGRGGPYFHQRFIVTPDGVLTRLSSPQDIPLSVTIPLLKNDGRKLQTHISNNIAQTQYPGAVDQQNFISLNKDVIVDSSAPPLQSTYGWLQPVRFTTKQDTNSVYIYPRQDDDPSSENFRKMFSFTKDGYKSLTHSVDGTIYKGQTAAGGLGKKIDLDNDKKPDVVFNDVCKFVLQLENGKVKAVEVDRDVIMDLYGSTYKLKPYNPLAICN